MSSHPTHRHEVQVAGSSDFLPIAALDRVAWGDAPFIADGEHAWRVWCEYATVLLVRRMSEAKDETGDVGGALVMFPTHDDKLFLHKIMVHPDCRGQGVGTALMRAALARADRSVLLTVDPDNHAAIELYQKYGFRVHRHIEGYYRPHEHRDLMIYEPGENAR